MKKIIITGGAGFIAQKLAFALLNTYPDVHLTLLDIVPVETSDPRITGLTLDLSNREAVFSVICPEVDAVIHLAAIVSSQAESDPDLGYRINVQGTQHLLDAIKTVKPNIRLIFASSLAVYGGNLPALITDETAVTPQSSYGTQKAMAELLINDYSRKGFVDGFALRLPTVCIRPGKPNQAASSFVSSIIREPLHGESAILPVSRNLKLWLSGANTIVKNLIHALTLPSLPRDDWHVINLPGFTISVNAMLDALAQVKGEAVRALVVEKFDPQIDAIVSRWATAIDDQSAIARGFQRDANFKVLIDEFISEYLPTTKGD